MVAREPLPEGWKGVMRDGLTRVGAFLQRGSRLPPLFIVKMSQRVNVLHISVGFGRINMYTYFGREYVLSLLLLLDGGPRYEEVDCLFNPRKQKDRELLSALSTSETVDVAFVVDNTKMTFLGTKRFPWPEQKCARVLTLLATPLASRGPTQKHSWASIVEAHRMSTDVQRLAFPSVAEPPSLPVASAVQPQSVSTLSPSRSLSDSRSASWRQAMGVRTVPLLLDRSLPRRDGARAIDPRTLDQYLSMQSACLMTDALRQNIESPILRPAKHPLHIEREH